MTMNSLSLSHTHFSPISFIRKFEVYAGPSSMFKKFSYKETKKATNNFNTVIGQGGFGTVYKAQLNDGSVVAVKHMDKVSEQAVEEFCREIELLARLHHRHLVALKGFCIEKHERFLMYEYMANGSLKDHLHTPGLPRLSWQTRIQIAIDVANALTPTMPESIQDTDSTFTVKKKKPQEETEPKPLVSVGRSRSQATTRRVAPATAPETVATLSTKQLQNGDLYVGSFSGNVPHAFLLLYIGVVCNTNVSRYARFNVMQAVVLAVLLVLPILAQWIFNPRPHRIGWKIVVMSHNAIFVFVVVCVVYTFVYSILG